ncbi:hypothetical protein F5Y17DRAFT_37005 [Xylariaceae sp. FL0594]|nr:hypothetical protein F5Y17DRAFT_37005 [Xylariaceae sp. FL0594]
MSTDSPSNRGLLTITVTNNSGVMQSYGLFSAVPTITPASDPVFNDIITVFKGVPGNGGQAFFTMPSAELYAICGAVNRDAIDDGVQKEIVDKQAVVLGHTADDGKTVPGSTCSVLVENGSPTFDRGASVAPMGNAGCFCVRTNTDFSYKEAKQGRYVLGFGVSTTPQMVKDVGPFAMFCPAPNTSYQIMPSNVFYVAIGTFYPRDATPEGLETSSCKIDFNQLPSNDVGLVHDERGKLTVFANKPRL